jgi:hypothetical protein
VSLSVCLIAADPASRIETILEPLRPYADEIVIAADSRVEDETLAAYASLADRLFRIEFCMAERHLPWLLAQCEGDWILRLDGDEVPSGAFVRRLPELLSSRAVQQYWGAIAWIYPDTDRCLANLPWSGDFASRLVRNDGTLRVRGVQHLHVDAVSPREYVEEPFYHLELLISDEQQRRDKAVRYEVARPHIPASGGGRINEAFYMPELRNSLEFRTVPAEDRDIIARALRVPAMTPAMARSKPSARIEDVPFVSLAEMDRLWEERVVEESTYHASLEPRESVLSFAPSEQRHVYFHVSNEGSERWPARLDAKPQIRLSYRWLNRDGSIHTAEGPRSPFSRTVNPGERILTPLHVDAPSTSGDYVLEVDVVHEDVRWFDCSCRVPAHVGDLSGLPPTGPRLSETMPPRAKRWRRMRIPRTIHRVWFGEKPMSAEHERFGETFAFHHPSWDTRLWTDADLLELDITADERERARTPSELSNLARYEILSRHGGVYVDTDLECQRPLDPLLRGIDAFAALEATGRLATGILGSVADHPIFTRAARNARRTLGVGAHSADANGPYFFTLIAEQEIGREPSIAIFGASLFYPYSWTELERCHERFPDAYAIHHWALSWHDAAR